MSNHKALIANVGTAVATAAVLGLLGWATGIFSAGQDALTKQQIKDVVGEVLIRDNGATYAASLASIDLSLASISTSVNELKGDVDALEVAVLALAAE